jgi:hypothetical protein
VLERIHLARDRHAQPREQQRQAEGGQQQGRDRDAGMARVLLREALERRDAHEDAERQQQRPDQAASDSLNPIGARAGLALSCGRRHSRSLVRLGVGFVRPGGLGRCEPKVPAGRGDVTTDGPEGVAYRRFVTHAHEGRRLIRGRSRRSTVTLARAGSIGAGLCLLVAFAAAPPTVEAASCKGGSHPAPVLSAGKASPGTGKPSTTITFSVTYTDAGGCAPTAIAVVIQGAGQYAMSGPGSGFAGGVTFVVSRTLAPGSWNYDFTASSGTGAGAKTTVLTATAPNSVVITAPPPPTPKPTPKPTPPAPVHRGRRVPPPAAGEADTAAAPGGHRRANAGSIVAVASPVATDRVLQLARRIGCVGDATGRTRWAVCHRMTAPDRVTRRRGRSRRRRRRLPAAAPCSSTATTTPPGTGRGRMVSAATSVALGALGAAAADAGVRSALAAV